MLMQYFILGKVAWTSEQSTLDPKNRVWVLLCPCPSQWVDAVLTIGRATKSEGANTLNLPESV